MIWWQDEILFSTDPIDLSELVQESAKLYAEATLAGGGGHRDQQHGNRHGGPVVQVRSALALAAAAYGRGKGRR